MKKILIALGGNALMRSNEKGTWDEQVAHARHTCHQIEQLLEAGYHVAITHGNGPQVGSILLQNEIAKEKLPSMPLDVCGAQSQGMIGYMLQKELKHLLKEKHSVVTIVSQVVVDPKDPSFQNPTKPIGPFYTEQQAENLKKSNQWTMVYQQGKGHRRVVPSPKPIDIIEKEVIKKLYDQKEIVIACGGGGIPVIVEKTGEIKGIEAVIDKDSTGALLAQILKVDIFVILTDVEKVAINFGKANQKNLDSLTIEEAEKYSKEGEFAKGSMGPKVSAAMNFIHNGGHEAIITSLENCVEALKGKTGTHFKK
jgi:carbamate kinase